MSVETSVSYSESHEILLKASEILLKETTEIHMESRNPELSSKDRESLTKRIKEVRSHIEILSKEMHAACCESLSQKNWSMSGFAEMAGFMANVMSCGKTDVMAYSLLDLAEKNIKKYEQ